MVSTWDFAWSIVGYVFGVFAIFLMISFVRYLVSPSTTTLVIPEGSVENLLHPKQRVKRFEQKRDEKLDLEKTMDDINTRRVPPDDPLLIELIRNYYVELPNEWSYNLEDPDKVDYFYGQTPYIDARLNFKEYGFFLESRSFDGEDGSISLFFEKYRHWGGILVEPNPIIYERLRKKNRKAYLINACIHDKPFPAKVIFQTPDVKDITVPKTGTYEAQCFPLKSILLALERTDITLLSLNFYETDSDGKSDQNLISHLPSEIIKFEFVTIRNYISKRGPTGPIEALLSVKNFELLDRLSTDDKWVNDWVFHNKNIEIANPIFWTWGAIFKGVFVFCVLYGIANVLVWKFYFKKSQIYKRYF